MTYTLVPEQDAAAGGSAAAVSFASAATNGRVTARTVPLFVPADQLYFWTRGWQTDEAESERARGEGRVRRFDDAGSLIRWLLTPED